MRGPAIVPHDPSVPERPTRRERFDELVVDLVTDIDARWHDRLGLVEYAVEDTPILPDDWGLERVPMSSLIRGSGAEASRIVLFRRPIEPRCETRSDLEAMVQHLLVEQVAELLGLDADTVDPWSGGAD